MTAPVVVASLVRCCVVCLGAGRMRFTVPTRRARGATADVGCLHCVHELPIAVIAWRRDKPRGAA